MLKKLAIVLLLQAASQPALPAPGGALGELDQVFLDAYQAAQSTVKLSHPPVVLMLGGSLALRLSGKPEVRERVIPDSYQAMKAVAHGPFAAYLMLNHTAGTRIDAPTRSALERLVALVPAARTHAGTFGLDQAQLTRQSTILDTTIQFVQKVLSAGTTSRAELDAFAKLESPWLRENTRDAGCAQVLATHEQMKKWRQAFPGEDWAHLVVINRGGHQARYRNAATQYFAWLIGGSSPSWTYPGENLRVVYGETLFSDDVMDLFATVTLDADAGRAFFGDEWRMSEDVLSDGAAQCVARLPSNEKLTSR